MPLQSTFKAANTALGILSKIPPVNVKRYPLPGREKRRVLLVVEFEKYIVACTHFSLNESDRLTSVSLINEIVKETTKPLFLAGDMNSEPDSPPQKALSRTFAVLSDVKQNTFPSINPDRSIDYIYLYRNGHDCSVLKSCVIDEPMASDYRPIYVDVRLLLNGTVRSTCRF